MNYKLAKQLLKAGFPQPKYFTAGNYHEKNEEMIFIPTLSELIKACPKEVKAPNHNTKAQKPIEHLFRLGWGDGWYAGYEFYESSIIELYGWGKTPEEAVARLWLQLNLPKTKL